MKQSKDNIINLEDFRVKRGNIVSKVFTGRDRGVYVRENSHIDDIDSKYETIEIIIPDNIKSINPSFFEELFRNVVTKHGRDEFMNKYKFRSLGTYKYERTLSEAIQRILRNNTAIG